MLSDDMPKVLARPYSAPPPISISAPVTRNASRLSSPVTEQRRRAMSCPGSPRALAKNKQTKAYGLLVPVSPSRALRRHTYHPVIGTDQRKLGSGVRHFLPKTPTLISETGTTTLEPLGTVMAAEVCPVHAYADPTSTLNRTGATKFDQDHRREPVKSGPAVHAYMGSSSTLKLAGAAAFSREAKSTRAGRETSGPVTHAYASLGSTLKKTGGATFGTPHVTPRRMMNLSVSRSGLQCSTSSTARPPRGVRHSVSHRELPMVRVM